MFSVNHSLKRNWPDTEDCSLFAAFCKLINEYRLGGDLFDPPYEHCVQLQEELGDAEIDRDVMYFPDISSDSEPDDGALLDPLDPEYEPE